MLAIFVLTMVNLFLLFFKLDLIFYPRHKVDDNNIVSLNFPHRDVKCL